MGVKKGIKKDQKRRLCIRKMTRAKPETLGFSALTSAFF
jgi:hypothetical protein